MRPRKKALDEGAGKATSVGKVGAFPELQDRPNVLDASADTSTLPRKQRTPEPGPSAAPPLPHSNPLSSLGGPAPRV